MVCGSLHVTTSFTIFTHYGGWRFSKNDQHEELQSINHKLPILSLSPAIERTDLIEAILRCGFSG